jgi:segregation and condensation protein B
VTDTPETNSTAIDSPVSREIQAALEAIIYAADEPATLDQIAHALGVEKSVARAALDLLVAAYSVEDRGIEVRKVAGGWKFYTKPQHHDAVRKFIKSLQPPLRLTMPALETLAVIAYRQPATVPEINEIRGVNVGGVIKTLLEKRLITTAGRKEVIGRPILYRTSKQFLMRFGLSDLDELPSLKEFEQLAQAALGSDAGIAPIEPESMDVAPEASSAGSSTAGDAAPPAGSPSAGSPADSSLGREAAPVSASSAASHQGREAEAASAATSAAAPPGSSSIGREVASGTASAAASATASGPATASAATSGAASAATSVPTFDEGGPGGIPEGAPLSEPFAEPGDMTAADSAAADQVRALDDSASLLDSSSRLDSASLIDPESDNDLGELGEDPLEDPLESEESADSLRRSRAASAGHSEKK